MSDMRNSNQSKAVCGDAKKKNKAINKNKKPTHTESRKGISSGQCPVNSNSQKGSQALHNYQVNMKKYEKMIGAAKDNFADINLDETELEECTICCKPNDLFGLGQCRHPVCVECAIRIRILSKNTSCPVCRSTIDQLVFAFTSTGLDTVSLSPQLSDHPDETRYGIRFTNSRAGIRYEKYLAHVCKICKSPDGERLEFPTFISLRQHMATSHNLSYCHICTENLDLFSRERRTYNRDGLQRHIRVGDFDDKSQRGHPLCLFCEQRFFDEESRYRHLRKEHFFCQFCEAEGTHLNVFFESHEALLNHYKDSHYLCEADECKNMGIAFANQLDLNLHKSKEHSGKRTGLALDFQFSDRQLVGPSRAQRRDPVPQISRQRERIVVIPQQPQQHQSSQTSDFVVVPSAQSSNRTMKYNLAPAYTPQQQDFPSLNGSTSVTAPPAELTPNDFPRLNRVNHPGQPLSSRKVIKTIPVEEAFPSLGRPGSSSSQVKMQQGIAPSWSKHTEQFEVIDENERVGSHSAGSSVPPLISGRETSDVERHRALSSRGIVDDYPALSTANPPNLNNSVWGRNNIKGSAIVVGCTIPKNYGRKKALPEPELWPDQIAIPATQKCTEEEWKEIPSKSKKSTRKDTKEKSSIELPKSLNSTTLEDIGTMIATSVPYAMNNSTKQDQSGKDHQKNENTMKIELGEGEVRVMKDSRSDGSKSRKKKNNNVRENYLPTYMNGIQGEVVDEKQSHIKEIEMKATEVNTEKTTSNTELLMTSQNETPQERDEQQPSTAQGHSSIFSSLFNFPSMSSLFSGLSRSTMVDDNCQSISADSATDLPPGLSIATSAVPLTLSPNIMSGPPPGFEYVKPMSCPPGLPKNKTLFSMAPFINNDDIKETNGPGTSELDNSDGWVRNERKKKISHKHL